MPRIRTPFDAQDLIWRYVTLEHSTVRIARDLGVSVSTVCERLDFLGVFRRPRTAPKARRTFPLDDATLRHRYVDLQQSTVEIGRSIGTTAVAVGQRLTAIGVPHRSLSEANRLRYRNISPEKLRAQRAAQSRSLRGRTRPPRALEAAALSRQASGRAIGKGEVAFGAWLHERGVEAIPQLAIDRYNVDFAVLPVVVEVHWHVSSPFGFPKTRAKIKDLVDRGYWVYAIWVTKHFPLSSEAADDFLTFLELARRDPAAGGQYRVVRGGGELVAAGGDDFDQWAIVKASRYRFERRVDPD